MLASIIVFVGLSVGVTAQSPAWGQCGGIGWTGATTCIAGSTCVKQNDYYSQCLPGATQTPAPSTTATSAPVPTGTAVPNANYWFSFGDSYTQTGFEVTGTAPSVGNPLGNPPYPGWTATGGENWIDYDSTTFNKSFILTYNFAYGGATIDANLVKPYEPTVRSLTDQVNIFLNSLGKPTASVPWTSKNALFSIWIGINDIGNSYYLGGDRGADAGARNFLFLNVPPIQRSPLMLAQSTDAQNSEANVINGFNSRLAAKITSFKANNSGVTTYLYDTYTGFAKILDNPKSYGFKDATSYGSGADIFWGNDYHPSSYAHKYFAQDVAQVLKSSVW